MNTDKSSQLTPTLPAHYQWLSHSLVPEPASPSHVGCLDILHNCTYLLDLFSAIGIDSQSEGGGLSTEGANAFYQLTHTLRYVSLSLRDIEVENKAQSQALKGCAFVQALYDSNEVYQQAVFAGLAGCLGIDRGDIDAFMALVDA